MPHDENIREFTKAFNCGSKLVETYSRLIAIELRLHDVAPLKTHRILDKLQNLSTTLAGTPYAGALNARQLELRRAFRQVWTETQKGPTPIRTGSYPDLRYCRFARDWPSQTTSSTALTSLHKVAQSTVRTLGQAGYTIWKHFLNSGKHYKSRSQGRS